MTQVTEESIRLYKQQQREDLEERIEFIRLAVEKMSEAHQYERMMDHRDQEHVRGNTLSGKIVRLGKRMSELRQRIREI